MYILKDFSDSDVEPCKEPFEQLEQLAEESQNEKVEGFKSKYFIDACIKQVYVCIGSFDLENKFGNNMCIWLWILIFIFVIYMIHSSMYMVFKCDYEYSFLFPNQISILTAIKNISFGK